MDPTQAISVAKDLGVGSAQMILAFVAVGAVIAAAWAIRAVIKEIKTCGEERTKLATDAIAAQHATADALSKNTAAIESHSEVMKIGLEALKAR